jgi:hypothetical protein
VVQEEEIQQMEHQEQMVLVAAVVEDQTVEVVVAVELV